MLNSRYKHAREKRMLIWVYHMNFSKNYMFFAKSYYTPYLFKSVQPKTFVWNYIMTGFVRMETAITGIGIFG